MYMDEILQWRINRHKANKLYREIFNRTIDVIKEDPSMPDYRYFEIVTGRTYNDPGYTDRELKIVEDAIFDAEYAARLAYMKAHPLHLANGHNMSPMAALRLFREEGGLKYLDNLEHI